MHFHYSKAQDLSIARALSLEWLETNGLGGYASSSILNCHTRKYHGLLVSKLDSLPDKQVLLSKIEDVFVPNSPDSVEFGGCGKEYHLSADQYPNHFQDGSFSNFQKFSIDTHPHFSYKFGNITLEKELLLLHETNTILIKYTLKSDSDEHDGEDLRKCKIKIRPFLAYRNFHSLVKECPLQSAEVTSSDLGWKFSPKVNMPSLFLQTSFACQPDFVCVKDAYFQSQPLWYKNFLYEQERIRGYEYSEDLFTPGELTLSFVNSPEIILAFSLDEDLNNQGLFLCFKKEIERRQNLQHKFSKWPFQRQLQTVAQSFMQKIPKPNCSSQDDESFSVVAGYHWFLEWGRDALISLPGLTLYSGFEGKCLAVLKEFARHEQQGLIPNFIGETKAQNAYNSVDASLWFVWAAQQYYLKTKDDKGIFDWLWATLKNIYENYKCGILTKDKEEWLVKMQDNGLLYAGNADTNLTWMDAMVNGRPVTPRYGYQVEINALWFNMLSFIHALATLYEDPLKNEIAALLPKIRLNFCQVFWNPNLGYLYDFVNQDENNAQIRPNQLFAASLPYSPLPKAIALKVMEKVQQELLTPYGLRTLSPKDRDYRAEYGGSEEERDLAYHNGTVWPWLLGHCGEALLKVHNREKALLIMKPSLVALKAHLFEAGVGSISEVFSGSAPHHPNGCISQAWSVAEVLRLTYLLEPVSKL